MPSVLIIYPQLFQMKALLASLNLCAVCIWNFDSWLCTDLYVTDILFSIKIKCTETIPEEIVFRILKQGFNKFCASKNI